MRQRSSVSSRPRGVPLWVAIAVISVLQVVAASGLVWFLSYRGLQAAVADLSGRLRQQVSGRIEEHLGVFLEIPRRVNALNLAAIRQGQLGTTDPTTLRRAFWEQIRIYDSVNDIHFGSPSGGAVGSGRDSAGDVLCVAGTDGFESGTFGKYVADPYGNPGELVAEAPGYDARTRPWYAGAVERGSAGWSGVYVPFTVQDVALSASFPVYDGERLLGVLAVDVFLSQLNTFLTSLDISPTGIAYVMDRAGLLVASSTQESPFVSAEDGGRPSRRAALDSSIPLIGRTTESLARRFVTYDSLSERQSFDVTVSGGRQFVEVVPFGGEHELDWLIVVVIPEADLMATVIAGSRTTLVLVLLMMVCAAILAVVVARGEAGPIRDLTAMADAVGEGPWEGRLRGGNIREIRLLAGSFTAMADRLDRTLKSLRSEVAERRQTERALRDSEERLALALRGAEMATWDWDVRTGRLQLNPRWSTMLGYSPEEIDPHLRTWERLLHPDDAPEVERVLRAHLEGLTPAYQATYRMRTKSGGWRWVLDTGTVLSRDGAGAPLRAAGVHLDVTDLHRVEDELRDANRRLLETVEELRGAQAVVVRQERLAAVGEIAAGIAHVFNNVITGVVGYAEVIRATRGIPPSTAEDAAGIIAECRRAADLITQLQGFGRASAARSSRLNLARVVAAGMKEIEPSIPPGVRSSMHLPSDGATVLGDEAHLLEVIRAVARNAFDAMPEGGELRVSVESTVAAEGTRCAVCGEGLSGPWVVLSVSDSGPGISADALPRVFEPFFTTRPGRAAAGLGLPQVAGIVEQHGGHILLESREGEGTTVTIFLPCADPAFR